MSSITVTQARLLAQLLTLAADKAEIAGTDSVELQSKLQTLDDQARDELQAAIDAAGTKTDQ